MVLYEVKDEPSELESTVKGSNPNSANNGTMNKSLKPPVIDFCINEMRGLEQISLLLPQLYYYF